MYCLFYLYRTIQNLIVLKCVLKEMKKLRSCIGLCIYPYLVLLFKSHVYSFKDSYTCFTLMPHASLVLEVYEDLGFVVVIDS